MRALLQRVSNASVTVEGQIIGQIEHGLLIFVCAMPDDTHATAQGLAQKIAKLRLFKDDAGKMNRSLPDTGGSALIVSQFTLAAIWRKGNRPGFSAAAEPEMAEKHYQYFCRQLAAEGVPVRTGKFRSPMAVSLVNDGPVTIWMDSKDK